MAPSPNDLTRYHRQTLLPEIGDVGQRRLADAHALIVGCGALGTVSAEYLARAGVGRITIIDRDVVEPTNLQRQLLFDEADAASGAPKADAARRKLAAINSTITLNAVVADLNHTNAERLARMHDAADPSSPPDVIIDGADNFETRYLLNDLAIKHAIPFVYAGAVGTSATAFVVLPDAGPCIRCLYPDLPAPGATPTCDTAGVLGPLVGMAACWQAIEALKILVHDHAAVSRALWTWDAWRAAGAVRTINTANARDPDCQCCAHKQFEFLEGRAASRTTTLCGRHAVQLTPPTAHTATTVDLTALAARLRPLADDVTANEFLVRATLPAEPSEIDDPVQLTIFSDGRTVVRGTSRPEFARSLYAKYIGA